MSIRQYLVTVNDEDDEFTVRAAIALVPSGMKIQFMDMDTSDLTHSLRLRFPVLFSGKTSDLPDILTKMFKRWFE